MDLRAIYLETLDRCAPERLVRRHVEPSMPRNIVAIGKCAGAMLDGVAAVHPIESAFVAIPEGYRLPTSAAKVHVGGHPRMTPASFAAGRALVEFVETHDDILFLVSGGGSACAEVPLAPLTENDVAEANVRLIASGLPIGTINAERKRLSAIKGGRLAARVRGRCVTLLYSDVATGAIEDVASGPTVAPGTTTLVVADNTTLTATASAIAGTGSTRMESQIECRIESAVDLLVRHARALEPGGILVAGGEPTVEVRGHGRGGRCSELAVRFALAWNRDPAPGSFSALFGSSDGIDGNSGVAGFFLPRLPTPLDPALAALALASSDSFRIASQVGEPIMIAPAGNNLRDLFLVARDD